MKTRIFWKLFLSFIAVIILSFLIFYLFLIPSIKDFQEPVLSVEHSIGLAAIPALLIVFFISLLIARSLSKSIRSILALAGRVSKGDFTQKMISNRRDELGHLERKIQNMADSLQTQINQVLTEKEQLHTVLESMMEGVLVIDFSGKIILYNSWLSQMFSPSLLAHGRSVIESLRINDIHESVVTVLQTGSSDQRQVLVPMLHQEKYFIVHSSPIRIDHQQQGCVSVIMDITEQKKLESQRREFVANVSHELKTPLTTIIGYAETLKMGNIEDKTQIQKFSDKIEKSAHHLLSLVEDILELSAIESGRVTTQAIQTDLGQLIDKLLLEYQVLARKKKISLTCDMSERISLTLDPKDLEQVVKNFLDNAIKYTPAGGHVSIYVAMDDSQCAIAVKDTGVGIEPELKDRIFERFFRVDPSRNREIKGTGLGLSIVKHLCQMHEWKIEVESEPSKGSVFRLIIPLFCHQNVTKGSS